jgi:hypothetical protein
MSNETLWQYDIGNALVYDGDMNIVIHWQDDNVDNNNKIKMGECLVMPAPYITFVVHT